MSIKDNPGDCGGLDCAKALDRIHAVLDGDLMDAALQRSLDLHLDGCASCREARPELEHIQ